MNLLYCDSEWTGMSMGLEMLTEKKYKKYKLTTGFVQTSELQRDQTQNLCKDILISQVIDQKTWPQSKHNQTKNDDKQKSASLDQGMCSGFQEKTN